MEPMEKEKEVSKDTTATIVGSSWIEDPKVDTNENHFDEPHAVTEDAIWTTEAEAEETMDAI